MSLSNPGLSRRQRRLDAHNRAHRPHGLASRAALTLALAVGLHASHAAAADFEVTNLLDSGEGSLRQAITDANAAAGPDVVSFAPGLTGTILLTSGEMVISDSVTVSGPGASVVSVSGNHTSRVFQLNGPSAVIDVTISRLSVVEGSADLGGGIRSLDENLTLDGVVLRDNEASNDGGGLWADGFNMNLTIRNSEISGNVAGRDGGGVYIEDTGGPLLIQDTSVSGNNAARKGGGIYFYDPDNDVTLERCTISGNSAGDLGGGVYLYSMDNGVLTIRDSTFEGNQGSAGGGIYVDDADRNTRIENTTISGNNATSDQGGGLAMGGADATIVVAHSTIVGNDAASEAGGVHLGDGTITLSHTIVANNTATAQPDLSASGTFNATHSLIEVADGASITDDGGNLTGVDPQLGALQNNGGPTATHLPATTSPAIDAGDPELADPPAADQRGVARIFNGKVDIGAVEFSPGFLQCSMADLQADEASGNVEVIITRAGGHDGAIGVNYASADGTGTAPGDLTAVSGTLAWVAGDSTSKALQVAVVDDGVGEDEETFTITLSAPTGGAIIGTPSTCTVHIEDSGAAPTIEAVADVTLAHNGSTTLTINIADPDTPLDGLIVSATSSNQALLADASLVVQGDAAARTLALSPTADQAGVATVTLTVSDGKFSAQTQFTVTVSAAPSMPDPGPQPDAGTGEEPEVPAEEEPGNMQPPEMPSDGDDGSMEPSKSSDDGGGGCSTVGARSGSSRMSVAGLLAMLGLVITRRRRRTSASKPS